MFGPGPAAVDPSMVDLADAAVTIDPFPVYDALRRHGSVVWLPRHGAWLVLGREAMRSALSRPEIFSSAPYARIDPVLLGADPPRHAAARRLVAGLFDGEAVRRLETLAGSVSTQLLKSRFDAVADFGVPLSRAVANGLIAFEPEALAAVTEAAPKPGSPPPDLGGLISTLEREAPRSGLFTRLAGGPETIGEAQARSLVALLWIAGTITTERVITRCVQHLLGAPDLAAELRRSPDRLPRFIEEATRLNPPEHLVTRRTVEACELAGVSLAAGSLVHLCTSAANRDPSYYRSPAVMDLARSPADHLSFGAGIHACIGAALTRRVVRTALSALLEASDRLRPAEPLAGLAYLHSMQTLTPMRLEIAL